MNEHAAAMMIAILAIVAILWFSPRQDESFKVKCERVGGVVVHEKCVDKNVVKDIR